MEANFAGRQTSMAVQRNFVIFAALALAGCGAMPNLSLPDVKARNDFKGKPLSVVTAQLGNPDGQQTVNRQKIYTWRIGNSVRECVIRVATADDIVESYETLGVSPICGPYEARAN
jgi:hypothetical protein